jgi:hypothetical protein
MDKYDFNDLLKDSGIHAVQQSLEQMVEIKDLSVLKSQEARLETDLNKVREKTNTCLVKIETKSIIQENKVKSHEMER